MALLALWGFRQVETPGIRAITNFKNFFLTMNDGIHHFGTLATCFFQISFEIFFTFCSFGAALLKGGLDRPYPPLLLLPLSTFVVRSLRSLLI